MFDIGWVEMMIVVVVMIVVIGPKELPAVLHSMGVWISRVRAMARSFQDSIEEMAADSGLGDIQDEVRSIRDFSIEDGIEKSIDPDGALREGITGDSATAKVAESGDSDGDEEGPTAIVDETPEPDLHDDTPEEDTPESDKTASGDKA